MPNTNDFAATWQNLYFPSFVLLTLLCELERAATTVEYIFLTTPQPPCTHNQSSVLHHLSLDFIITRSTAADDLNAFCLNEKGKSTSTFPIPNYNKNSLWENFKKQNRSQYERKGVKKRSKKSKDLKWEMKEGNEKHSMYDMYTKYICLSSIFFS